MADPISRLAAKLDGWYEQIVGIPRGGLIVAAALGYRLGIRDVGAFSTRYQRRTDGPPVITRVTCEPTIRRHSQVLLVEDGTASGTLMEYARTQLVIAGANVITAALWVSKAHDYRPDVWVEAVDVLPSAASLLGLPCG